jgi:general secretion pathway protein G
MEPLLKTHPKAGFPAVQAGPSRRRIGGFFSFESAGGNGFTLIELLIVMSIIGILATLAVPSYRTSVLKAKEASLKRDLFVFRDSIDQFRADQGRYPSSLKELVEKEYLRAIPVDPFTQSADTWVDVPAPEGTDSGVFDIHSGSDLVGTNNVPYNQW